MTPQPAPAPVFALLRFTPVQKSGGLLTQRREHLGTFSEPESAFATAKQKAWAAIRQLAQDLGAAPASLHADLQIRDTEWGYDLLRDGQLVDRFWVHDQHPRRPI